MSFKYFLSFISVLLAGLLFSGSASADEANYEIIHTNIALTWFEAKDSAASLGGQLAVINDSLEQEIIASLLSENDSAWIGGTDYVAEGRWVWHNGADWNYENWAPQQPDTSAIYDYLLITHENNGQWTTGGITSSAFIVEWGCCIGQTTGNTNCDQDNIVNILDITRLIDYLYDSQNSLCCPEAANTDGDPERNISLTDIMALIDYLYNTHELPASCPSLVIEPTDTVIITDQLGKEWDITYGAHFYGLDPDDFNFGQGQYFFTPIINPEFFLPGDSGYPSPNETFQIMGLSIDGDTRAYPISVMHYHEVADDQFDSTYIAVTY